MDSGCDLVRQSALLWHPNYYVQRIFASNVGTRILQATPQAQDHLYTAASLDERTHEIVLTVVNVSSGSRSTEIDLKGVATSGTAKVITLASDDLKAENSFDHPENVALENSTIEVKETLPAPIKDTRHAGHH